jgi:anti-sigma B factor antagonist
MPDAETPDNPVSSLYLQLGPISPENDRDPDEPITLHALGVIDATTAPELRKLTRSLIEAGYRNIQITLDQVVDVDTTGLGCLVGAWRRMHRAGGRFVLVEPSARLARVLSLTGLDRTLLIQPEKTPVPARDTSAKSPANDSRELRLKLIRQRIQEVGVRADEAAERVRQLNDPVRHRDVTQEHRRRAMELAEESAAAYRRAQDRAVDQLESSELAHRRAAARHRVLLAEGLGDAHHHLWAAQRHERWADQDRDRARQLRTGFE